MSETETLLEIDMSEIELLKKEIEELEEEIEDYEFGSYSYDVVSGELGIDRPGGHYGEVLTDNQIAMQRSGFR